MNVFEDLIVELQEENLLERTFIDVNRAERNDRDGLSGPTPVYDLPPEYEAEKNWSSERRTEAEIELLSDEPSTYGEIESVEVMSIGEQAAEAVVETTPIPAKPGNGSEFYKKRAVGEISGLQMVEHVITGVEREYMKIVPNAFDDFKAKKALNTFLQVAENENSVSHAEAEFSLLSETETWCTALAKRDNAVLVSSLRQYCENSRPPLSSQALLALARFYRNLPYTESVRSKFDFVVTRLFSRPAENERRICLFTRDEMQAHINTLYKDWSSVALYSADDDESNEFLTMMSFEDLAVEAEGAVNFDQLIESDFFGRVRLFKEGISELFYAPGVTAAAIDANVRIGNAFVGLIEHERQSRDAQFIKTKYGSLQDMAVSDAAARTLDLVDLLRAPMLPAEVIVTVIEPPETELEHRPEPVANAKPNAIQVLWQGRSPLVDKFLENARSVNRWFAAISMFMIVVSFGIYIWANFFVKDEISTVGIKTVDVDNSPLKDYAKSARVSGENLFVLMLPAWDALPKEKRQEFLQRAYRLAQEKGCTQVSLIGKDGKATGFASATRLDITMP